MLASRLVRPGTIYRLLVTSPPLPPPQAVPGAGLPSGAARHHIPCVGDISSPLPPQAVPGAGLPAGAARHHIPCVGDIPSPSPRRRYLVLASRLVRPGTIYRVLVTSPPPPPTGGTWCWPPV